MSVSDERPFTTLEVDYIDGNASLKMGCTYQVHAGGAGVFGKPNLHIDANGIVVRNDFHVFETPKKG